MTLGLSPRGLLIWQRVAQARCLPWPVETSSSPTTYKTLPLPFSKSGWESSRKRTKHVLSEIMSSVPVPVYPTKAAPGPASTRHASVS